MTTAKAWLMLSGLAVAAIGLHWGREFLRVDSCLEAGQLYNYTTETCDAEALTLPVVPYSERHSDLIQAGLGVPLIGFLSAATAAARGKARERDKVREKP